MENEKEEALQRQAEQNQMKGFDKDSRAYQIVFNALQKETGFQLSPRFADQVIHQLQQQRKFRTTHEYVWLGLGIFLFIVAAVVTVVKTDFRPEWGFLNGISRYLNVFIFGAVFILALQWLDRKFVRRITMN
jgi:hypothetical protein